MATFYEQQKKARKAKQALAIKREAAILAQERWNGARLKDLTPQQLADVMADATEGVLS